MPNVAVCCCGCCCWWWCNVEAFGKDEEPKGEEGRSWASKRLFQCCEGGAATGDDEKKAMVGRRICTVMPPIWSVGRS